MSGPTTLEFGGTDEELEKYLLEFARAIGGRAGRKGAGFLVAAGSLLSTNPNTLPLAWRVAREGGSLVLSPELRALPWTREKVRRIVAFRTAQLADFLTARVRGGGREAFDALRLREPYANFGGSAAAVTASFSWAVACALAAMAAALAIVTIACLPLMNVAIADILERARTARAAGGVALPNPDRPLSALGAALVFAAPLAFLAGLVHSLALAAGELWFRADRVPIASFLFIAALFAAAFFSHLPALAVPIAFAVPIAIHLGYTAAWSRRRERLREGGRPKKAVLLAGTALAVVMISALVPRPASGREWTDRLALFRDRFMLGHPLGKLAASTYYEHTLVGAELLKRFFAADPNEPVRILRTASCEDPAGEAALRRLGFTVVTDPRRAVDARLPRGSQVSVEDLDKRAGEAFRGSTLRQIYGLAWFSVYYAGPPALLAVVLGALCPGASLLFRKLPRRAALLTLGAVLLASATILFAEISQDPEAWGLLRALRESPGPGPIARALASPSAAVRHEAAFRACEHPDASLGAPLLRAADDPDLRVRLWAVAALGKVRHPDALPKLIERLNDSELFVRYRAAEGLEFLGRPEAVEPLLRMTREGIWYEGLYALEALRRLDPGKY